MGKNAWYKSNATVVILNRQENESTTRVFACSSPLCVVKGGKHAK